MEQDVIIERINGLTNLINQKFDDNKAEHIRIEMQTLKTNGSVTTIDKRISDLEAVKNKMVGSLIIMNVVFIPLLLLLFKIYIEK